MTKHNPITIFYHHQRLIGSKRSYLCYSLRTRGYGCGSMEKVLTLLENVFERKLRQLQKIKFNLPRHTPMRFRYEAHKNLCVHSTGYAANCPSTLKRLKELGMICYEGTNSVICTCICQVNEASVFNPVPSLVPSTVQDYIPYRAGRRNQRISGSIWLLARHAQFNWKSDIFGLPGSTGAIR